MLDFLSEPFSNERVVEPFPVLLHLMAALLLGLLVAWVYRRTRTKGDSVSSYSEWDCAWSVVGRLGLPDRRGCCQRARPCPVS